MATTVTPPAPETRDIEYEEDELWLEWMAKAAEDHAVYALRDFLITVIAAVVGMAFFTTGSSDLDHRHGPLFWALFTADALAFAAGVILTLILFLGFIWYFGRCLLFSYRLDARVEKEST